MRLNLLIGLLFIGLVFQAQGQNIVINEVMAKNHVTVSDVDGDFSDWIELYNAGPSAVNLENYSISDDATNLQKWTFPSVTIQPNGFLMVFASGKDVLDVTELHTNFKISSSGEAIYLSTNVAGLVSQIAVVSLATDETFGQVPNGSGNWIRIATPSPGLSNNSSNELVFSHPQGFYTSAFSLHIQSLLQDSVFYTLNGDLPSPSSSLYDGSIFVDENMAPNVFSEVPSTPDAALISYPGWSSPEVSLDKAVVLRCASFRNGERTSKVYTKSYFVDRQIFEKYSIPIISLVTEGNNFFDEQMGIYVPGVHYNSNDPEWTGNYFMRGIQWERDIHLTYFSNDGELGFSQDAGVRIHGGKTRQASQKSLKFYARNEYGQEYFNHQLLPHKPIESYKRFILRTTMGGRGETIIRDVIGQNASRFLDVDFQDFQPAVVFLNGEYWGIHTIRDRIDENFIEYTHDIDKDSVEFKSEAQDEYQELMDFIDQNPLTISHNYQHVVSQIELSNYIDYQIAEQFFVNLDWPSNNQKMWRKKDGGKWRWILYDLDAGLWDAKYNMLNHCTSDDPGIPMPDAAQSTFLFRKLLENESFRNQFVSRYAEVLNADFQTDSLIDKMDGIMAIYDPEVSSHIERWNFPSSLTNWRRIVDNDLNRFVQERPCAVKKNIMSFFKLSHFDFECDINEETNDLILGPNPNQGSFFIFNESADITNARITITDIKGSQIYHNRANFNLNRGDWFYFDLPNLASNMYLLTVTSATYSDQKKVIVIK